MVKFLLSFLLLGPFLKVLSSDIIDLIAPKLNFLPSIYYLVDHGTNQLVKLSNFRFRWQRPQARMTFFPFCTKLMLFRLRLGFELVVLFVLTVKIHATDFLTGFKLLVPWNEVVITCLLCFVAFNHLLGHGPKIVTFKVVFETNCLFVIITLLFDHDYVILFNKQHCLVKSLFFFRFILHFGHNITFNFLNCFS